jgi:hypothetical protein
VQGACGWRIVGSSSVWLLASCAGVPSFTSQDGLQEVLTEGLIFSTVQAGLEPSQLWIHCPVLPNKQLTQYSFVEGTSVGAKRITADEKIQ